MNEPRDPYETRETGQAGYGGPGAEAEMPPGREGIESVSDPDAGRRGDEVPGAPEDYTEEAGEPS